jgi:hypothetical protein
MIFRPYRWHGSDYVSYEFDGARADLLRVILIAFDDGLPLGFSIEDVVVAPHGSGEIVSAPGYGVIGWID